jgi:DeoR/GlpR family transcriptional regulator of sugar metabolism
MTERSREFFLEERRQKIVDDVNRRQRATVAGLAEQFGVSEVTIRTDLQALAARHLIVRAHGGAVATGRSIGELSLAVRSQQQTDQKDRIGEVAAAMVTDGDAIFLDSSSTTMAIARRIKGHRDLTVLTNSLAIAYEMLDAPGVNVVMPGGTVRREAASILGVRGLEIFRKFNLQKGFFGAHGMTLQEGLTDVSAGEAEMKRPVVEMCRQVIAVLDATKWGQVGLASFADLSALHCVVTNQNAPTDLLEQVRAMGIQVMLA